MRLDGSKRLYERMVRSVPSGTHSNSRARSPYPVYFERAKGPHLWDVDGNRWIDFTMGNAAVLLGHGNEHVRDSVVAALDAGLGAGVESELSAVAAEAFLTMVKQAEQVRFTNTGTEAMMHAVHTARAVTGRSGIAKTEGAYHGWWDDVYVSTWPDLSQAGSREAPRPLPGAGGLSPQAVEASLVIPFNDLEAARSRLTQAKDQIAALVVEPVMIDVGLIPPGEGYLHGLQELTRELGIALIFDELLTGFRIGTGGAQGHYGVQPDLAIWGKALANGFPIAAVSGTREYMARTQPGPDNSSFVGTFNGYRPALAACTATLEQLADGTVIDRVKQRSEQLKASFERLGRERGVPVQLSTIGGHFQPYFTAEDVVDYRSAATTDAATYARWAAGLEASDIQVPGKPLLHAAFSAAHRDEDFEALLDATDKAFAHMEARHA